MPIHSLIIPSPLGDLIAIASETHLCVLEFASTSLKELPGTKCKAEDWFEGKIQKLQSPGFTTNTGESSLFIKGANTILEQTKRELDEYFSGKRKTFSIPLAPNGTDFQKKAWQALEQIPYGETRNYKEEAILAGNPKAIRAIGGANNKNPIVVIIPCHRVIGASGALVGYGGGVERKKWLLEHEKSFL